MRTWGNTGWSPDRTLGVAVALSIVIHGVFLFTHWGSKKSFHIIPPDTSLEVVLVNTRSQKIPQKPDAVAQANLDGGGQVDRGYSKSPLAQTQKALPEKRVAATEKKIRALEKQQEKLMGQVKDALGRQSVSPIEKGKADVTQQAGETANRAAVLEKNISDQGKQPKKTYITPRTREVGYAMYYKVMQRKIEEVGTLNFPEQNGRRLYGELIVYIPVSQDGRIYEKEGGPRIQRSSGNPVLDQAALKIIRRAAPFAAFPAKMRSKVGGDVWVVVTRFRFTRDEQLQTQLRD